MILDKLTDRLVQDLEIKRSMLLEKYEKEEEKVRIKLIQRADPI
jgi:hypothetical protein